MYYTGSVTITVIKRWRIEFMDISNRNPQTASSQNRGFANGGSASDQQNSGKNTKPKAKKESLYRVGVVASTFAIVILLAGLALLIYSNNNITKDTESNYIKTSKLQAVFLNTGQVYFGNITTLNNNFFVLTNIFYLQTASSSSTTSTTSSSSNVSLVKLGCELHMPYDQMVINRSEVTFWENLQSNGQVAQAVSRYDAAHPNGQQCTDQSSSSSNTSSSVQNAGTNSSSSSSEDTTK
jgi:hypothetical protein